ncbi:hypothetical protein ABZU78_25345 [Rhodococcus erythropolis]|uniref:hypothetical protein n=1 Tax=Rhodococcus erythropolis TaxID=1833 RepID=UPI0033B1F540
MKKILNSLSEDEYVLVLDTKKDRMADLDEDDLIALHTRVRRARTKYTKNYRRAGADKVGDKKARGSGKSANARNAGKAEVFEDALSRVSRRLAAVSKQSARDLKDERLQRARRDAPSFSDITTGTGKAVSSGKARVDATRAGSGKKKFEASSIAAGARRQAKKDHR